MNFNLSTENWQKVMKGAMIASVGAGLTYLSQALTGMEFGTLTPIITAAMAVLTNIIRKMKDTDGPVDEG